MAASRSQSAVDLMCQYAAYHRDRRNIATHFVGIPLIVLAVGVLLARIPLELAGFNSNVAWLVWALSTVWYLTRGNLVLGLAVSLVNAALMALAQTVVEHTLGASLAWGIGLFALGWVIQFVGHYYEGRKPAFADDLVGLAVGPMFVVGEALFAGGWGREMLAEIERRAGPTRLRDLARPST
ncbi:MAG: DUF962 domain-containing protein [Burkholderiaceae bacterium]|nr:DUF962 domain-containing protein [Burkholderiaceae bacterium]